MTGAKGSAWSTNLNKFHWAAIARSARSYNSGSGECIGGDSYRGALPWTVDG